jgi:hypothetical protein
MSSGVLHLFGLFGYPAPILLNNSDILGILPRCEADYKRKITGSHIKDYQSFQIDYIYEYSKIYGVLILNP